MGRSNTPVLCCEQEFPLSDSDGLPMEGDLGLGIVVGLIAGCVGAIVVFAIAKPETKRGVLIGVGLQLAVGILYTIVRANL